MINIIERMQLSIEVDTGKITGTLTLPETAQGLVVFAHSHDKSRHSSHNQVVADTLNRSGFATLRLHLLTPEEEMTDLRSQTLRFNIRLLSKRLREITDWLAHQPLTQGLQIGYFGTNAGAAAALVAAADRPNLVKAVVLRGSCPDLGSASLHRVQAAILLIAGEYDFPTICANQDTLAQIQSEKRLIIIPRATHLFEESGTLAAAIQCANQWYQQHLASTALAA